MKIVATVVLVYATVGVSAQSTLTKAQEGRKEVGQCYSVCTERYVKGFSAAAIGISKWWEIGISDDYLNLDMASQESATDALGVTYCALLAAALEDMRSCRDGCADVEAAYSYRTSRARTRFLRLFDSEMASAEEIDFCDEWGGLTVSDGPPKVKAAPKAPPKRAVRAGAGVGQNAN